MSHRCPECGCTVFGGGWCDRPCWTCEDRYYGSGRSWRMVGFWLGIAAGLFWLAMR